MTEFQKKIKAILEMDEKDWVEYQIRKVIENSRKKCTDLDKLIIQDFYEKNT